MKPLGPRKLKEIKDLIKLLLHASRDCYRNQKRWDTRSIRFDVNDAYYGECFGILRALEVLGYGYLGPNNLDAVQHGRGDVPHLNLQWWFSQLQEEVLKEEGWYSDNRCEHCLEKYGKDDQSVYGPPNKPDKEAADMAAAGLSGERWGGGTADG